MINRLQKSLRDKDKGFTLVELLVVIVIIGILAGIAIPLFLNQRKKGVDAGTQSDLKALATVQETYYVDKQVYTTVKADLTAEGWIPTDGSVVGAAIVDGAYCLRGYNPDGSKNAAGTAYFYASDGGGLSDTQKGVCAGLLDAAFTTVS